MAAVFTDSSDPLQTEGFKPRRDIKLALTCGEETSDTFDGVEWLIETHPEAVRRVRLNEGAAAELDETGKPSRCRSRPGEGPTRISPSRDEPNGGGHSSRPEKDNAIYHLAPRLSRSRREVSE
jgi:hypothetical protein